MRLLSVLISVLLTSCATAPRYTSSATILKACDTIMYINAHDSEGKVRGTVSQYQSGEVDKEAMKKYAEKASEEGTVDIIDLNVALDEYLHVRCPDEGTEL